MPQGSFSGENASLQTRDGIFHYDEIEALAEVRSSARAAIQPRGAYVDPLSPSEVNTFINAQQEQWRPVLEAFEASIKKDGQQVARSNEVTKKERCRLSAQRVD